MSLIEREKIVQVAQHAYDEWNLAMAGAENNRQINKTYKRQELCKAVEAVAKAAPTVEAIPVAVLQAKISGIDAADQCDQASSGDLQLRRAIQAVLNWYGSPDYLRLQMREEKR